MDLLTELEVLKQNMTGAPFNGKASEVILFLVRETLDALRRGIEVAGFERHQIVSGCVPASKADQLDPKIWMPHVDQLRRVLASQSNSVELLYKRGGGRGIVSNYRLRLVEGSTEEVVSGREQLEREGHAIRYTRSAVNEIKPFFLVRPFFKKELKNSSWRGAVFLLGFVFFGGLFCAAVPLLLLLVLVYGPSAIELKQLVTLGLVAAIFWWVWRLVYEPFFRLIDSRVVKAPSWIAGVMEDPCELEMYRQDDGQWTRLVRFKSDCSLCGGRVELREGKPEHSYPLVGRCVNSPYAHVYSFDRMLLHGAYIGPPLGYASGLER